MSMVIDKLSCKKEYRVKVCKVMQNRDEGYMDSCRDKYHMISLMGRIFKNDTNELICKTKTNLTDLENELEGLE